MILINDKIMHNSGIYIITNKKNNKVYIGSTIDFRKRCHQHKNALLQDKHCNNHLQYSWNFYGEDTFEFGILEYIDNPKDMYIAEQFWIDIYREENRELYNIVLVVSKPMLGRTHTKEARRKLSKAHSGKKLSEEHIRKLKESHKGMLGKTHTKEAKRKIGNANRGKIRSEELKCRLSEIHRGRITSEETRQKLSKALMGHPVSEETRRKISEGHKGKQLSEETKRKISESRKRRIINGT